YYQPLHPAVLRLIAGVVDAAAREERPLTICGDMAGDPLYTELLVGLGLRELSVAPGELLDVKSRVRRMKLEDARERARQARARGPAAETEELPARRGAGRRAPARAHRRARPPPASWRSRSPSTRSAP